MLVGNGRRLVYRRGNPTPARVVNQKEIKFTENKWQHSNGRPVSREDLMMTLANLDSISIRTIYDNHMVSVGLGDIVMETTAVEFSTLGHAKDVEECRCPPGYSGLSCEMCSPGFERVPGGSYLGTCAGCNCYGHASACDPISGHCLSCQHNTEGPQCDKCRPGYFGDPSRGRPDDCKPCPCPYYETSRRFSDTCFLDVDQQPTCDACRPGYTGRRCEKCAPGYQGNPVLPNGKCAPIQNSKCDNRGTISSSSRPCSCKNNVAGAVCDECKAGFFHLSETNPEGCLRCFCMGVTKQCASSTWNRDQVRGGVNGQLFSLSNSANTKTISEGISQRGSSEVVYRLFSSVPKDIYYWVLPESFRGDKVTAYGGELRYTVRFEPFQRSLVIDGLPDVVLQGNGIFLEHYSKTKPLPRAPQTVTVVFRESGWRRADGQPCTREHLLMALADVTVFMIRATYVDNMVETSISDIKMDVAVPHSTGNERALEVEECACPQGYRGPSCQECDEGYTRTSSGLYLGTCERCDCNGHASGCDAETGRCLQCLHNTAGPRCELCQTGFYGNPVTGGAQACQPCPCPGTTSSNQFSPTCFLESDGQPTCDNCPPGYAGRRCERCGIYEDSCLGKSIFATPRAKMTREEKPSADSCGDPFLLKHMEGLLPVGCGAEAVFNFSWEKEIDSYSSGDDDEDQWPSTTGITVIPTSTLSAAAHHSTTHSTTATGVAIVSVNPNRSAPRLPPRFTPSSESRHSSFQHLLRIHLNTFNQRLSMLESNTLDMKESIHSVENQQSHLSSLLTELVAMQSAGEKNKKVSELEKSYIDMDARLTRLEGRLEILIDGFTALAQEMNRMKRARHVSRSPMEKTVQPSLATVLALPLYSTPQPPVRVIPTKICAAGYTGNPLLGQRCSVGNNEVNGNCFNCDQRGNEGCTGGVCRCKINVEGPSCSSCKSGTFHLSLENKDGCLSCFCMGVTQQCSSSTHYRDQVSSVFSPGNFQGFALVNRQRTNRIFTGFTVEVSTEGTQLSYTNFDYLGQEPHYWQLPEVYQGDKKESLFARTRRAEQGDVRQLDDEVWALFSNFSNGRAGSPPFFPSSSKSYSYSSSSSSFFFFFSSSSSSRVPTSPSSSSSRSSFRNLSPPSPLSGIASSVSPTRRQPYSPGHSRHLQSKNAVSKTSARASGDGSKYALVYKGFSLHQDDLLYWQLPAQFTGDKVGSYGGKLKYSVSYVAGPRGTILEDGDVQIIGNDITLVARQPWQRRQQGSRETQRFEIVFKEENWNRPDGMPATREHLLMVLADLDDILIRASYSTEMRSSSIFDINMEVAVPNYSGLAQALEVEQCRCPPAYQGLSCQSCLHNTQGELCEQCAPGFFGDPTAGTPEDCQPCACPHTDPDNQFSPTCESLGNGNYQCTACQPGYTGQFCERCASGYVGNPQEREKCRPHDVAASLVVKVYPERVLSLPGSPVTLRCQVSGSPPHYFYWSREDGRPVSSSVDRRRQGAELYFPSVQPGDAGVYICTCRDQRSINRSRAEIVVTSVPSKAIEVTVEEPKAQTVRSPAYTLVWTRMGNGKLPNRAMDFNGILTIQNVQPEDAGVYVCTGSNMFAMDEGNAILYVPEASQTQMFYTAYEMFEGHGKTAEGAVPVATVTPSVLNVQQGQRAEFRCTVTGNPTAAIEWKESNPSGLGTQPQVQVSPQKIEAHEGDNLRLYCRATGVPTPKLTWLKNGGQIPPQAIPSHGFHQFKSNSLDVLQRRIEELQARMDRTDIGTLLIPNIQITDSGTYMCVGSNSIGSNSAPIKVSVLKADHSSSVVSIQPSIADVQEGQSLELNCFAPGNPPPQVTWTKAGGRLSSNHQVLGSQLRIQSATPEDSGEYICRVQGNPGNPGSHVHQASVSVSVTSSSSRLQSPIIAIEPHSAAVRVGESASFRCRVYSGQQPVRLEWKLANNQPLPDNVKVGNDGSIVTITNARPMNHGAYRCVASNPFGITHTIVSLIVKESPVATVTPVGPMHVRVGEPINLECQASGEPRPSVSWHRLDSNRKIMLSSPVPMESNAVMQDSGTYVCTARNNEGTTETKVEVIVEGGSQVPTVPRASVPEPLMIVVEGQSATLRCEAHGVPSPTITWTKLRSPLPWRHKIVNNSLVLPTVGRQDSGEYICTATNNMGTTEVTILLDVETPPYATSVPDNVAVRVGEVIRLQCLAHGTPPLTYIWTKLDGNMPPRAQVSGGDLQINLATAEDAGSYKCVASNKVAKSEVIAKVTVRSPLAVRVSPQVEVKAQGSAVEIENLEQSNEGVYICRASSGYGQAQDTARLTIQALPKVMINVRTSVQTVMIGNSVEFECQAVGDPEPTVKWSKVGGSLPAHIMVKGGMLRIDQPSLKFLRCLKLRRSQLGLMQSCPVWLQDTLYLRSNGPRWKESFLLKRVMPYFAQDPVSYLTLPTIKNAYKAFSIKINFRPDNVDGMILYNGQRRTTGADFISLGLVGGRLEFRFDVGSGMASIRDPNPVKLGEFHTVELYRNHTLGYIIVDGGEPINGSSQGKFQGLDLNEELHVGGYPNYTVLAKTAGIKTGFVGCIRQLVIQGEEVIFKDLDRSSTGVTNCPTCKDHPCQCGCPRGFTGSNCQHHSSLHCHSEACGPDATCINRQNGLGYDCRCHLGKFGNKCMDGELVTTPLFDGEESYIAYPPLTNVHDDLRVELEFKPLERDGLMFFCGGKKMKVEDFVAISMVEGHVEFRFELGTGQAILLSPEPVSLGQWHRVVAERNKKAGYLRVDQGPVERKTSPGSTQGLNIHTPMYLGGVPSMDILPKPANVSELFKGCIGEVAINNKKVDLSYSFTESRSIRKCVDNSPCDRRPCLNGGHCMSSVEYEYQCLCKDGFEGERCEVVKDVCQSNLQCHNGGSCVAGQCVCAPGHTGLSCEENSPYQYAAHFHGDGYVALPRSIFTRSAHDLPETIELEINTSSSEGLILWQGVEPGENGKGKDFISLGLQNGHVVFRSGKDGYIQIDGGAALHGQSKGKSLMVNTKGNLYLGGAPEMSAMTGGKFLSGMTGCVRNLALINARPGQQPAQAIDLQTYAAHGINVQPCSS
ncbi:hypothetical protein FQN60_002239 [Etheostoma spectabile]|uniref:Basement membrane-specific heparan sulfate proteoglycan core protein n=1 Tax=Etheostoma spectabile TaxID=54343 RepID=A0A5J5DDH5_9PERO|nr:hypothetical protein FQN60_002239 [Etheostoma spectabile]